MFFLCLQLFFLSLLPQFKNTMKKLLFLLLACFCIANAQAAYLRNIPMTVTQPDGTVLQCFASGDEYFNYLHDENGFTIMKHPQTGYYVYAVKRDGKLVATNYVAGVYDPASKGLKPYALISPEEWMARRKAWEEPEKQSKNRDYIPNHGTLNNISIFVRFSDDDEFANSYTAIDNMFNDVSDNAVSMRSYFRAASYGSIEIPTTFYPGHNGDIIISYQDTQPRSYFNPYNASTNPNGYQDDSDRTQREHALLARAVNYINANYPISSDLNIDYDGDGYVDNVCFIVKGNVGDWNDLLWPHKWALYNEEVYINGKRVWTFNFQLADASSYFNAAVMCHEMNHSLSAPDLYHYYYGTSLSPVGPWDLMENTANPPQHCGAYMKMKYGHWIDEIPEITQAGTYTLNPISSSTPTNVAYKIASSDPNQFYVVEYRNNTSLFETSLPGSGLLVYRIDTRFDGNASYNPDNGIYDEVYLYRPGGTTTSNGTLSQAHFSSGVGRTSFDASTNPYPFFTDGTIDNNFRIYNITSAGNTISFSYGTTSDCDAPTNLVASVEDNNVTLTWNAANNAQSYNVYRSGTLIGNTSGTTFSDISVAYGRYNYFLKSVDSNGLLSAASETVTVSVLPDGSIFIGDGSSITNDYLPSYSYYKYSLTQQIYTSDELGGSGTITGIAFYNGGAEKTRTYDFYLKTTTKNAFSGTTDLEIVSVADKVFSKSVTMKANEWNEIIFDVPFEYDGTSNLVLVADDNSGAWTNSPHMSCRVFEATSQAIRVYSDYSNYNPTAQISYSNNDQAALLSVKNQLLVSKVNNITVSASPVQGGTVSGGGEYYYGDSCTVTATVNEGFYFLGWIENDEVVSTDLSYTFVVVQNRSLVATFAEGLLIGDGGTMTDAYLPSYSYYNYTLSQQIYTTEELGSTGLITGIAFYNGGATKTRTYDIYMASTTKSEFTGVTDWVTVTSDNLVFSGSIEMTANEWTTIEFITPFVYDGVSNVVLVADDNSGAYTSQPHMLCRVFDAPSQALRIYSDGTNYNPFAPSSYGGTVMNVKNQLMVTKSALDGCVNAAPSAVEVSDITNSAATVTWTGFSESYNVMLGIPTVATLVDEDFANGIPADWANSSSYPWSIVDGHIQSSNAGVANSTSSISITVTFLADGTVEFDAECMGEGTSTYWDHCDFYIDEERLVYAGENISGWNHYSFEVVAGAHTFTWSYTKDNSVDNPGDYFAVDNVVMRSVDVSWNDPITVEDTEYTFTSLTPSTDYCIRVQGFCDGTESAWSNKVFFSTTESTNETQTIALSAGANWFSTNLEITLDDLKAALVAALPGTNIVIKSKTQNAKYNGTTWRGDLTWDLSKMYLITVENACEITLEGEPINPADHPATILSGQSNWIAFPVNEEMTLSEAFANFNAISGDVIKSKTGNARYTGTMWRASGLDILEPGKGYLFNSATTTESRTLVFPSSAK